VLAEGEDESKSGRMVLGTWEIFPFFSFAGRQVDVDYAPVLEAISFRDQSRSRHSASETRTETIHLALSSLPFWEEEVFDALSL
jgi:hypothetical protein